MSRTSRTLLGAAATALALPTLAWSQGQEELVGEDILVEARLFAEPVENVPGRIELVLPEDLRTRSRVDLGDVTERTPNVTFQKTNADERLVIRGITAYPNALADPTGIVVNGVALPLGTTQAPNIFALDSAAVLVGPQGAHFGRNSEAGLIDLEFLGPGDLDGGQFKIGFAENATPFGSFVLGTKVDGFGIIFGVDADRSDGDVANLLTSSRDGGQSERLTALAGLSYETDGGTRLELTTVVEGEDMGKEQFRYSTGPLTTPRFLSNYNNPSTESRRSSVTSFRIDHRFGDLDLRSTTGFTTFSRDFTLDFDTSPLPLGVTTQDLNDWMVSQEFRLSSAPGGDRPLSWSIGASAYHQVTDVDFNLGAFATNRSTEIGQTGFALFGFAEYAVTQDLRLGAGGRLEYLGQDGAQTFASPFATLTYSYNVDTFTFLPKVTVAYDLTDEILFYANASRGYLAGGFNYNFANGPGNFTFDPEFSTTVEGGVRIDYGSVSVDVAGFYTDVRDKQIVEVVPGGAQRISNAAKVETFGAELKVDAGLTDEVFIDGSVGILEANATDFQTTVFGFMGPVPADFSGNDLTFAPSFTYSAGIRYEGSEGFFASARVNGSTGYFFDAANTLRQPAFATADLRAGYTYDNFEFSVWVNNVFDQDFLTTALNTPRGTLVEDGPGRQIGAQLNITW